MTYKLNEHTTTDVQLVVFRDKCPFCVFIKSKPGKDGLKLRVPADAKYFYAYNMHANTDKTDGAREKKQGLWLSKMSVTLMEPEEVTPLNISLQVVN